MLRQVLTVVISLSFLILAFSGCIKTDNVINDKNDQVIIEETTNVDIENAIYEEIEELEELEALNGLAEVDELQEFEELAELDELEELEELIELEEIIESLEE